MSSSHLSNLILIAGEPENALLDYPGFSVFMFTVLTLAPLMRIGLSVTDAGFYLANQWRRGISEKNVDIDLLVKAGAHYADDYWHWPYSLYRHGAVCRARECQDHEQ